MADARHVGGGPHDEVAAEGEAEGGRAVEVEVVQDGGRWEFPTRLQRHARQGGVSLSGSVEGNDVEGAAGEVLGEAHDLLRVSVEAVHHDEGGRRVGEAGTIVRIGLPPDRRQ